MIQIKKITIKDVSYLDQLGELFLQLAPDLPIITSTHFDAILKNPNTQIWVAIHNDQIIGSITMACYSIPTGHRAWIEDVVVDINFRGQKIGEKLVVHVINEAKKSGIVQLDLTSRPERIEANKLYQKLGFELRNTNSYRLIIK